MIHNLKIYPEYFEAIVAEKKSFEVREDDRGFGENDILILEEFDPDNSVYTGRSLEAIVTYISWINISDITRFAIMSIKVTSL